MKGPYYATKSHDGSQWIVASPRGGAMFAPHHEGQRDEFDFRHEAAAKAWAQSLNKAITEWLVDNEQVRASEAIQNRMASWRYAAQMYAKTDPDMAARMEGNAEALEILLELSVGIGIDRMVEMLPGWSAMELPKEAGFDD
jgi:hypothetical protein